jgi:hypothetical protein
VLVATSVHIVCYRCWRLQVLALEGTCSLLEVVSVEGYMYLHWRQHVFALKVASAQVEEEHFCIILFSL